MMKVKYYNCPECGKKFKTLNGWGNHVDTIHPGLRPKDYSISRYFYFTKTGKTAGVCRTCKKPTPWNEETMKYDQYCTNPECKKAYVAIAKKRMMDKYGKTHLLDDPEHQKKMLKNRKIAGKYKFQDGTQFEYVGTYERKFLTMLDTLFDWHSNDLMAPSPHTYYYDYTNPKDKENEGRKFYIPDFYIPSLNLEIEIKQQTSTNQAFNDINRAKERIKDDVMSHNPKVNYLKLNDNHFEPFFELLMKAKEQIPSEKEDKTGELKIAQESSFRKEDGEGSSITMEDIKAFNKQLNSWKYGVLINGKIETNQYKIDWSKYKTTPIPIMMKKHVGVCWDFVNYEYHWFAKNNIDTRSYLFVMQRSDDPNDIVTHTFLIFNFNKQNYWFESSWYGHQWIKEVKNYKDVVKELVKRYGKHPYDVYTYDPEGLDRNLTNTEFFQNTTQNLIFSTNHHKPSKDVLYHGSSINLKEGQMLIPKNDSHDFGDAVFASSDRNFALCYSGGKWDNTIIRQGYYDGKLYLIEMEKGAFKKVFDRKGYLYSLRKSDSFKKGAMPNEFYSETKVPFLSKMPIDNVYDELKRVGVDLYPYPKKPYWFKGISMESKDASFIEKDFKGKPIHGIRYIDGASAEAWKYYKRYQADNLYKNMKSYWLSSNGAKAVLAIDSKKDMIAGYVCVRKEGTVQPIFVYPEYRGYGISKELMKRAIQDCGACKLGVYSDNQVAIKLYKSLGFKEYERKKYKDNDEAIMMRLDKNAMEPAQESVVLSKPDQWYNFDKFARGDTNLCFVTGRCESGKSTLTKKISTLTDAEHVEMDWLLFNSGLNPASSELEGEMMHDFFLKDGKKYKFSNDNEFEELAKKFKGNIELLEKTLTNDFVAFAKKYAEKHPRKKFILEGVHFFYYVNPKDLDGDYAVCIMGTSALKSIVRMHKRDHVDWKKYNGNFFEKTKDKLRLLLRDAGSIYNVENRLDIYRSYFSLKADETSRTEHTHSLRPLEMAPKIGSPKKTILVRSRTNPNEKRSIVTFPVKGYPTARGRSEMIIFRGNDIFIDTKHKGFPSVANPNSNAINYSIPGGGWEPDETPLQSAIREAQEEARINTTVMLPWGEYYYAGSYMYVMKEVPSWQKKAVPKEYQWRAQYTQVFIGCYQSKFTGRIDKEDELPSMVRNGKFVDYRKVYDKLHPVHQRAIDIYLEAQKEWDELHGKRTMKTKRKNKYQVMEALNSDLLRNTRAQYKVVGDASKVLQEKAVYCDSIDIIMESFMSTYLAKNGYNGITKDGEYKYVLGPGVFGKKVNSIDMESGIWQDGILMEPVKESIDPITHPPIDFEDILGILDMFPYDKSDFYVSYRAALVLRGIVPFTKDINLIIDENLRNELERDGYHGEQVEIQFEDEPAYRFIRYQINEYLECIYRENDIPTSVALVFNYQVAGMNILYSLYKKGQRFKDRQTFNQIEEYQNSIANSPNFMEQEIDDVVDNSNIKIDDLHLMDDQTALEQARFTKYERYPVYIVLMHTGTAMSHVIKFATGDRFSHALISFHAGLAPLYSFGKNDFLPEISDVVKERSKKSFHIGFVKQANGPDDKFYEVFKNTEYAVYVMFVSKQARDKMKARLSEFLKTEYEWRYDFFNLLSCKAGIPSEHSKRYFCSRFVMDIINAGKKTDKVPSLYKPQDIMDLDNITCVAEGKDFRKYNKKITMRNIDYLREGTPEKISMESTWMEELEDDDPFDIPVSYQMPAIESMVDDLAMENLFSGLLKFSMKHGDKGVAKDVNKFSWKSLFSRSILGSPFGNYRRYRVKVKDGNIEIYGINYKNLQTRIKKYYKDKSIFHMFLPKYNILSYRAFERKRIQRSDIKIDYIYAPDFFALEMATLFADLGARFRDTAYKAIAKQIYEISWLKTSDISSEQAPLLDTTPAKKALTYQLNDYQEDFISKYLKLKAQLNMNGYILAFEQGLGKTLTAIALSECLHIDHVYIVCPNSLKENWALEIQKYYKKYEDDDTWRSEVFICSDKEVLFNKHITKFLIINNESIKKMMPYVMPGKNMLILDESHSFRNINAKRLQDLFTLRDKMQPTDTLIMSGTPIKATPAEIVPSLMLIDPTCTQEAATLFTKAFKLKSSIGTSIVQARFGKIMYRKEKDVLEDKLPAKIVEDRFYKMSGSNKYLMSHVMQLVSERFDAIYDEGYKEFQSKEKPFLQLSHRYGNRNDYGRFVSCIREMVTKDKYLHEVDRIFVEDYMKECKKKMKPEVRKTYDALIKSYVRYKAHCLGLAFGEILPKYRRDLFIDLFDANINEFVDMINDNTKKVVIFSQFKGVVEHINDELNKHDVGTVMITGDITKRMPILKEFKENPQIQVLVATSQTVGTGMTLTEASMMLFFGTPYRDSDFAQCTDRIHRIGQTDDCYIYNVLLDTGDELNLSTRINNIIKWSHEMTSAIVNTTEDDEDLDDTKFVEVLSTDAK